ncbi:3-keto-disaccharide hydrolase [Algoriphagus namhaensis]
MRVKVQKLSFLALTYGLLGIAGLQAQTQLTLDSFSNTKGSWSSVAQVSTDPRTSQELEGKGKGDILLNAPSKKNSGTDIISKETFGDVDLRMSYMMAEGSNSGIYLQGQYEVQLFDSWTEKTPRSGGNAGIYERWDESKPEGQKGYQGYAPRQNVSKAPGLWQELEISFQAPKFDASGEKIANARFRYIKLNGVTVHEDVELLGPTRGALAGGEVAEGPIRIQGDHGPIAIRALEVKEMNFPAPQVNSISYDVYAGSYNEFPDFATAKKVKSASIDSFDDFQSGVSGPTLTKYQGVLNIQKAGKYKFSLAVPEGLGAMRIGEDQNPIRLNGYTTLVEKSLEPGEIPYTLWVSKPRDWSVRGFQWNVESESMWPVALSSPGVEMGFIQDPIWVDTEETPVLRSFVQLPSGKKLSHGVSVSSAGGIHFSYDLNSHQVLRVWRGEFLDATPMWNDRGNGVSLPLGVVTELNEGEPLFTGNEMLSIQTSGYEVIGDGEVRFLGQTDGGASFVDHLTLRSDGKGLHRVVTTEGLSEGMMIQVARGTDFVQIGEGFYWLEESGLYLEVTDASISPVLKEVDGEKRIYLPVTSEVDYTLMF